MIANKYQIGSRIGTGSFGSVYRAKNVRTGDEVAVKMEPKTTGLLANEARIYRYLMHMDRIPRMRWFGTKDDLSFLVLDLLRRRIPCIRMPFCRTSHLMRYSNVRYYKRPTHAQTITP